MQRNYICSEPSTSDRRPIVSRRDQLCDAGLDVLAAKGLRGLTHRAVDAAAGLPAGACSNVFRTRAALLEGLAERVFERLTPDLAELEAEAAAEPTRDQWVHLMQQLVRRVRAQPHLQLALLELRIESTRRPELVDPLTAVVRAAFDADVAFHERAGLAGGPEEIVLLHLAIGGLITDVLTLPDALPLDDVDGIIERLVDRLVFVGSAEQVGS